MLRMIRTRRRVGSMNEQITVSSATLHRDVRSVLNSASAGTDVLITRYRDIEAVLISHDRYLLLLSLEERETTGR